MERDPLVEAEPEDGVKLKGKQKCIQTNSLFVYRASTLAGAKEPIRIRLLSLTNALRERPTNDLSPSPRRCHLAGEANQIVDFPRPFHPLLSPRPPFLTLSQRRVDIFDEFGSWLVRSGDEVRGGRPPFEPQVTILREGAWRFRPSARPRIWRAVVSCFGIIGGWTLGVFRFYWNYILYFLILYLSTIWVVIWLFCTAMYPRFDLVLYPLFFFFISYPSTHMGSYLTSLYDHLLTFSSNSIPIFILLFGHLYKSIYLIIHSRFHDFMDIEFHFLL